MRAMNTHCLSLKTKPIKILNHQFVQGVGKKCPQDCNFLLHKACAELPRNKYHWVHLFSTTLFFYDIFECSTCFRLCSGFFYEIDERYFSLCLRCAALSDTLKCEAHQHLLSFDLEFRGQCNACGDNGARGAYRCKRCDFAVDFKSITLPHAAARYKYDEHPLKLSSHEEIVDAEEHYCDVCEEERNPNHWFYHCAVCDTSAHPTCVHGKYPFMKRGRTRVFDNNSQHPHLGVDKGFGTESRSSQNLQSWDQIGIGIFKRDIGLCLKF